MASFALVWHRSPPVCQPRPHPSYRQRLVWLAGLRWPIEQCFRDGKQLFGLGDYEGRGT